MTLERGVKKRKTTGLSGMSGGYQFYADSTFHLNPELVCLWTQQVTLRGMATLFPSR